MKYKLRFSLLLMMYVSIKKLKLTPFLFLYYDQPSFYTEFLPPLLIHRFPAHASPSQLIIPWKDTHIIKTPTFLTVYTEKITWFDVRSGVELNSSAGISPRPGQTLRQTDNQLRQHHGRLVEKYCCFGEMFVFSGEFGVLTVKYGVWGVCVCV